MNKLLILPIVFIIGVFSVIFTSFIFEKVYPYKQTEFGVTFSPRYAKYLGLDWQKTYIQILDELKVKNLRLPTYWTSLEPQEQEYDFSDTDFMLDLAAERGARVILAVGLRQPRWPECHIPAWAKQLSVKNRQQKTLQLIEKVVERYKENDAIWAWQVENEPLFSSFGQGCDDFDKEFLKEEVELVRRLDQRPIILTDSGELGSWITPMQTSDILGISVYRTTYSYIFNYQTYPLTPFLYNLKSLLVKSIFGWHNQKTIVVELQTEPWLSMEDPQQKYPKGQRELFPEDDLRKNIDFGKKTGFDEIYLWGVEWWYFMAGQGYPQYLDYAKTLF